ncbi:MAG TPA: AAA family ATPase [Ktedonobacteraceae bacterium]|jgi:adenylate kinase family enzyme
MAEIVFLLGRPGSGKSRTARYIAEMAAGHSPHEGQAVQHVTDYGFLHRMFQEDLAKEAASRRFRPTRFGGFDVLDLSVLPLALMQVNAYIARRLHAERTLILVEFARQSYGYQEVWQYFRRDVLSRAFFLHLEADIETCMQRISKRARYQAFSDDQFVSPEIMFDYYGSSSDKAACLKQYFGREHVATVENAGAWQETSYRIDHFLCTVPTLLLWPHGRLPGLC